MRIAIIGAGNMGGAIACGLAQGHFTETRNIIVANPHNEKLQRLQARVPGIQVTNDNKEAARGADIVIVAVKPWKVKEVLSPIHPQRPQILVSLAAGISMEQLAQYVDPEMPIFRVIPNTAIDVRASMTFLCGRNASDEQTKLLLDIFNGMGLAMMVKEEQFEAATALSSCGIAFVLKYVQAAMQAGVEMGLPPQSSMRMVAQSLRGAAELLLQNDTHPAVEIEKVTTPGGITIKGLNELEHAGFASAVIRAMKASR